MRIVILACVALLTGCDKKFTLKGTIARSDGTPVAGATVRVNCGGSMQAETKSDPNGHFIGHDIGWYPSSCVIEALVPGAAQSTTWPMMPACTRKHGANACLEVTADLRLP